MDDPMEIVTAAVAALFVTMTLLVTCAWAAGTTEFPWTLPFVAYFAWRQVR